MSKTPHPVAPRMGKMTGDKKRPRRGDHIDNCSESLWRVCDRARLKSWIPFRSGLAALRCPMPPVQPTADLPARYEDALAELDRLVQAMEGNLQPLEGLLDNYRRGAQLLAYCRDRLQAVEDQVKVLEDGQLKDWTGA